MSSRPRAAPASLALRVVALLAALLTAAASCSPGDPATNPSAATQVRIGAGSTAEQQLLAALSADLLARRGIPTEVVAELGDTDGVRDAADAGRIDAFWDYSGAAWTLGLGRPAPAIDPQESVEAVAAQDAAEGLTWLPASAVDAKLALFVRAEEHPRTEEGTLSWLAGRLGAESAALCADAAYLSAPAGYAYLADTYAIATDSVSTVVATEPKAIDFVVQGECLAGLATATSGAARARGLLPLVDDQGVFPAFVAAPVVVQGGRAEAVAVVAALTALSESLDTAGLANLNALVSEGGAIEEVAVLHLDEAGLG